MIKKIIFSLLFFVMAGCGYTTRSMISNEYRTIFIAPFVNKIDITRDSDSGTKYKIYRPSLETDITKAVNNKYLFDGNLKPVKKESAYLLLEGEVVDFRKEPLRYTDNDEVYEYRINVVANLKLYDTKKNKLLWQENNFTGYYSYFTQGSSVSSEASTINSAVNDLARRIVERTVEQW
jgi:hypothetical protein